MLVGHFAVGFIAKRAEPRLSLGTLFLAVMTADFLWCVFMLTGLEHVQFRPGMGAANYFVASNIALSHSLLTNAVWGILFALAYFWGRRYLRGAWILGLAVLSHWFLDFISHRPDMPLAPGATRYYGLGLWTSTWATILVEGGLWVLAIVIYLRSTKPKNRLGTLAFWPVILFLTLAWYGNIAGPPPPPDSAAVRSLVFFALIVAWAYWINWLRPVRT